MQDKLQAQMRKQIRKEAHNQISNNVRKEIHRDHKAINRIKEMLTDLDRIIRIKIVRRISRVRSKINRMRLSQIRQTHLNKISRARKEINLIRVRIIHNKIILVRRINRVRSRIQIRISRSLKAQHRILILRQVHLQQMNRHRIV